MESVPFAPPPMKWGGGYRRLLDLFPTYYHSSSTYIKTNNLFLHFINRQTIKDQDEWFDLIFCYRGFNITIGFFLYRETLQGAIAFHDIFSGLYKRYQMKTGGHVNQGLKNFVSPCMTQWLPES